MATSFKIINRETFVVKKQIML